MYVEGTGEQTRNFIFVEDLATGAVKAINESCRNKIITVAGKDAIKIIDLAELIKKIFSKDNIKIICNKSKRRNDDYSGSMQDIELNKSILDWEPRTTLKAGVEKYIDWLRHDEI